MAIALFTGMSMQHALAQAPGAGTRDNEPLPVFDIFEYVVNGNSLLSVPAVEVAISPFLGERKTVRDVEAARVALEKAYHGIGYLTVLVSIPEQSVDSGTVALQVVEATIDRLTVKGTEYTLPGDIRSRVPELAQGNVPNFNKLQTQLAAVNRGSDIRATPILRAGKLPGTVEAQLDVEDQLPLHGSVDWNNRASPNTTAQRLSASLRYDNLWQLGHSVGLTLQTAPLRSADAEVIAGTYVMPIRPSGGAVTLYAVRSRSEFAIVSTDLGVASNANTYGVRYSLPLGAPEDAQTVGIGADYKNVKASTLFRGTALPNTPITYVPLVATYNGNWVSQQRSTAVDVKATLGLRNLFGNSDGQFLSRGASANYQVLRAGVSHTENISRWGLYGKLDFQVPSGTLVSTERFIAGGADTVRGYLEGERAGDSGLRATVELRSPQLNMGDAASAWRYSTFSFLDAARLTTEQGGGLKDTQQLRSAGFGLRLFAPRGLTLELDVARALVNGDPGFTKTGDLRVHSRMLWGF